MTASSTDLQGSPDEKWDPGWSNAVFSLAERDRRWAKVRALMARDGIDLIVCMPLHELARPRRRRRAVSHPTR